MQSLTLENRPTLPLEIRETARLPRWVTSTKTSYHGYGGNAVQLARTEELPARQTAAIINRNTEIRTIHARRFLYGDINPTQPLSDRELQKAMKQNTDEFRFWRGVGVAMSISALLYAAVYAIVN